MERNINDMFLYQSQSRSSEARDMALISDNNNYVQTWSLAQIVVIMIAGAVQVRKYISRIKKKTKYSLIIAFAFFRYILYVNYLILNRLVTHEQEPRKAVLKTMREA